MGGVGAVRAAAVGAVGRARGVAVCAAYHKAGRAARRQKQLIVVLKTGRRTYARAVKARVGVEFGDPSRDAAAYQRVTDARRFLEGRPRGGVVGVG